MELILKYAVITYILTQLLAEPMFWLKTKLKPKFLQWLVTKTYCWKCFTFWSTWIVSADLYFACQVTLAVIIVESFKDSYDTTK